MTEVAANYGRGVGSAFGQEYTDVAKAWSDGKFGVSDLAAPVGAGLDLLGAFLDPVSWVVGNLLEPIYNWIFERCEPCKRVIESVTGSPDQVRSWAEQFQTAAKGVAESANQLLEQVNRALSEWEGQARDAFRQVAEQAVEMQRSQADTLHKASELGYGLAGIVSVFKEIIITLIKQLINDLVSKGIMAALAAVPSLGAAVAAYMAWAAGKYALVMGRVARSLQKLFSKAADLVGKATKFGKFLENIAERLGRLAAHFDDIKARADSTRSTLDRRNQAQERAAERQRRADQHYQNAEQMDGRARRTETRKGDTQIRRRDQQLDRANQLGKESLEQAGGIGASPSKPWNYVPPFGKYDGGQRHENTGNPADDIGELVE
ncbi:WXG100 family type VII secretion target [Tessaracoccus sp. OH4464_COT-324]|uniref:WXG100 family type VII secretion target n=1 Tax=Tessaracoccus sp. OH4464_COT-324 TaxID=2491059 RepID=UPI000F6449CF|nr:WXG100 family type VII secretion target [Tessaracoccus sp. OH4464_COT-324]RRD46893.1 WXG100 family type VII secretion target [Tessaracoccus sp. OH4464_COT-324]